MTDSNNQWAVCSNLFGETPALADDEEHFAPGWSRFATANEAGEAAEILSELCPNAIFDTIKVEAN